MPATVSYETLRNFNLVGDLKTKYLDVKATKITVVIEIDQALDELIKAGKESLKISHLGDVAKAEVEKSATSGGCPLAGIANAIGFVPSIRWRAP